MRIQQYIDNNTADANQEAVCIDFVRSIGWLARMFVTRMEGCARRMCGRVRKLRFKKPLTLPAGGSSRVVPKNAKIVENTIACNTCCVFIVQDLFSTIHANLLPTMQATCEFKSNKQEKKHGIA
jgi:hypothetical protein